MCPQSPANSDFCLVEPHPCIFKSSSTYYEYMILALHPLLPPFLMQ